MAEKINRAAKKKDIMITKESDFLEVCFLCCPGVSGVMVVSERGPFLDSSNCLGCTSNVMPWVEESPFFTVNFCPVGMA